MNRLIAPLSALLLLFTAGIQPLSATSPSGGEQQPGEQLKPYSVHSIIAYSRQMIGTPYRYGGMSERGFDCSGLLNYVFEAHGLDLARSSSAIFNEAETIDLDSLRPGDFLFFKGRSLASKRIGHIAMVTSVDDGRIRMIHATSRGVVEDVYQESPYYQRRYLGAARKYDFEQLARLLATLETVGNGLHFRM